MINKEIDSEKVVSGLLIDLSKAIDGVIHRLLFRKLEYAGIRGVALVDVTVGVPPLLFIVFINDFYNITIKSAPFGFADDSNMFESSVIVAESVLSLSKDLVIIA